MTTPFLQDLTFITWRNREKRFADGHTEWTKVLAHSGAGVFGTFERGGQYPATTARLNGHHPDGRPDEAWFDGPDQWGLAHTLTTATAVLDCDDPAEYLKTRLSRHFGYDDRCLERGDHYHVLLDLRDLDEELRGQITQGKVNATDHLKINGGFTPYPGTMHGSGAAYKVVVRPNGETPYVVMTEEMFADALLDRKDAGALAVRTGGPTGHTGLGHDTEMAGYCLELAHKGLTEEQIYEQWRARADDEQDPAHPFTESDFRRHMRNVPAKYEAFKAEHSWPGFTPPPATRTAVATHLSTEQVPGPPALHVATEDDEPASGQLPGDEREPMNITNSAVLVDVLCEKLGTGSLEGVFNRADKLVVVPRYGEIGYQPDREKTVADPPAKIIDMNEGYLRGFLHGRRYCFKTNKEGDHIRALPPLDACQTTISSMPETWRGVPRLSGVTHTPLIRRDGSVLTLPGYDAATEMLYLPNEGYGAMQIPEVPSAADVAAAREYLLAMVKDFPFVTDGDRASYLGALMTPALRLLLPPPWPQVGVNAPQQGSGKTLLATVIRLIYGGEEHSAPESGKQSDTDEELRKVISTILRENTGSVVVFDNMTGVFRSAKMAKLLTGLHWDDRGLGGLKGVHAVNDRLWILTGNNLQVGGDLPRRTIWTSINAQMEHPENRKVVITDLPGWVEANKQHIIQAVLVLARAAIPGLEQALITLRRRNDCYGRWDAGMRHVLAVAGIKGEFWAQESVGSRVGADDEEWSNFLAAVWKVCGDQPFTTKWLSQACVVNYTTSTIGDALPGDLADLLAKNTNTPAVLNRKLAWWFRNRKDRWADGYSACSDGKDGHNNALWSIKHTE